MSVFVLIFILVIGGDMHSGTAGFSTQAACEAAKAPVFNQAAAMNATAVGASCVEVKLGEPA